MRFIEIICGYCNKTVDKPAKEITRQRKNGNTLFFCNNSCGSKFSNAPRKAKEITKVCPTCSSHFVTREIFRETTFCSRLCANQAPLDRRLSEEGKNTLHLTGLTQKHNLIPASPETITILLKSREAWKYVEIEELLSDVPHEFEVLIDNFVFDLVLYGQGIIVEFDSPYHKLKTQKDIDKKKESIAHKHGYQVLRGHTEYSGIIPVSALNEALENAL